MPLLIIIFWFLIGRRIMFHGSAIRMHMHAVVRNALHSQFYSCTRLAYTWSSLMLYFQNWECKLQFRWCLKSVLIFLYHVALRFCSSTKFFFLFISMWWFAIDLIQNWSKSSLISKMKDLAERRKLEDLTVGPVLTVCLLLVPLLLYCSIQLNTILGLQNQLIS